MLNRNIGCIEIDALCSTWFMREKLNRNIGCIEIQISMINNESYTC